MDWVPAFRTGTEFEIREIRVIRGYEVKVWLWFRCAMLLVANLSGVSGLPSTNGRLEVGQLLTIDNKEKARGRAAYRSPPARGPIQVGIKVTSPAINYRLAATADDFQCMVSLLLSVAQSRR
jgi:hypothetical protein